VAVVGGVEVLDQRPRRQRRLRLDEAVRREHGAERADANDPAGGQGARVGGEEPDRDRLREAGHRDLVRHRLAEREAEGNVEEVDPDGMADERGERRPRHSRCRADDRDVVARCRDQLDEAEAVAQPEHRGDALRRAHGGGELVGMNPSRMEVRSRDSEPRPVGAQAVGERHEAHLPLPCDDDRVHLRALDEPLEQSLLRAGLGEGGMEMRLEVAGLVDPVETTLALRVGRLEHRRETDGLGCGSALGEVPHRGERGLRQPFLGERAAHRELVGEEVGGLSAERRQAEPLRHDGDHGHGAVAGGREHGVDGVPAGEVLDRVGLADVHELCDVGVAKAHRLGIVVDGDHAVTQAARLDDRGTLVAARADEEDSGHGAMLDVFRRPGGSEDGLDYHPGVALTGKRIVITGGAGFIGTTLARRLVDENEVIAVDNLHRDALSGTELAAHPNFRFAEGDVLDPERMTELFAGCTHVVHAAGIAGVDTVLSSPVRTMRVNVIGTYNALEAAFATKDTVERIVEFSTSEVFGQYAFNVQEAHVTTIGSVGEARWTYAVSKLAGEHMAHAYHGELGLPSVSVRPFNIYGPGQIGGGAIRAFIEAALGGEDLEIRGDGSQIRAWCYVDDMVEAVLLALEHPAAVGESFNVGNPRSAVTIYDLATRIKRLTGCPGELRFVPLRYIDVELRIPNVAKARTLLGFEAEVELDEGLERTIAWYRARLGAAA
jgi:UDP-glucose 4-epimerase